MTTDSRGSGLDFRLVKMFDPIKVAVVGEWMKYGSIPVEDQVWLRESGYVEPADVGNSYRITLLGKLCCLFDEYQRTLRN